VTSGDTRLLDVLASVWRALSRELADRLAEEKTTVDQWRVLRLLADSGEGTAPSELAERARIAAPSLTRLVDTLVDRALVYRRPSAVDGRRIDVHLSDAGRALLDRLTAIVAAHEAALADRVGADVLRDALAVLDRLDDRLSLDPASR
jgi:DNA-binding MarR family transcriptional regulator